MTKSLKPSPPKTAVCPQPLRLLLSLPAKMVQDLVDALLGAKQSMRLMVEVAEPAKVSGRLRRLPQIHLLALSLSDWLTIPANQQDAIQNHLSLLVLVQDEPEPVRDGETPLLFLTSTQLVHDLEQLCLALVNGADLAAAAADLGLEEWLHLPGTNSAIWPGTPEKPASAHDRTGAGHVQQQLFFAKGDQVNIRPKQENQGETGGISQQLFISLRDQVNTRPTQTSESRLTSVGNPIDVPPLGESICPACGLANIREAKYCQHCQHPFATPP